MLGDRFKQHAGAGKPCPRKWRGAVLTALGTSGVAILGTLAGVFQLLECATLDRYFQLRPPEPPDPRIVLVTIDEDDITKVGRWPLPDLVLAKLLLSVRSQQPRLIGLHLYRDVPVEPGYAALTEVLRTTPNLIAMEKLIGDSVAPPPVLEELNGVDRVALADMVLDPDGKVRRGLISVKPNNGNLRYTFAAALALHYLEASGINAHTDEDRPWSVRIGRATPLEPLQASDGGYVRIDDGGYQLLLNYRGTRQAFHHISMTDVLADKVPPGLMHDRIVIIGPVAASLKELYNTPYSQRSQQSYTQMSSLEIHANLTSQILSAALDGRQVFHFLSNPLEWLWILTWASSGTAIGWYWWHTSQFRSYTSPGWCLLGVYTVLACGSPLVLGYIAFLNGWWIPSVSPVAAALGSIVVVAAQKTHGLQRMATSDGLTQVANRRYFDAYLHRTWGLSLRKRKAISLILCDVDFFKPYNDTYGHPAGDRCLQQIAWAISQAVRRSDLVARYGGEEFAIVLPETHLDDAIKVAQRVREQVSALKIEHTASPMAHVTLSCGVTSIVPHGHLSVHDLVKAADCALYAAKKEGRNTYCVCKSWVGR
ncbi:MAG: diguanylate cyclase [Cyanobacteria bacterium SBC]|nr:diguanylate cyclase [Cyanobacteria bacterium SBC]